MKAEACDERTGFKESLKDAWSRDTDLGDGELKKQYQECSSKLS
jgi:hypothetical protein